MAAKEARAERRAQSAAKEEARVLRERERWRLEEREREVRRVFREAVCQIESERELVEIEIADFVAHSRQELKKMSEASRF